jgi:RNA polymerase sigma-70 factor (ECF subfamily)
LGDVASNRELLERIRRDEPGAFDDFVRLYGDRIYAFGMRVCGERQDAQDVAQDTLLQAFRKLRKLKEPGALRSWLYRVAANACLMKRRKLSGGKREVSLEELMPTPGATGELPDFRPLPDERASSEQLRASVREAIRELPKHYRIVLVLRDMEQLSTRETAEALELPEPTVKMRLHRARLMVRQSLETSLRRAGNGPG